MLENTGLEHESDLELPLFGSMLQLMLGLRHLRTGVAHLELCLLAHRELCLLAHLELCLLAQLELGFGFSLNTLVGVTLLDRDIDRKAQL